MILKEIQKYKDMKIVSFSIAAEVFRAIFNRVAEEDKEKEHLWVVGLDSKNKIKYLELVSLGSLDSSIVHPREIFRQAIIHNASCIIIGHNHPSGDTEPSKEDLEVTQRLKKAGEIIGISLIDHVIIGSEDHHISVCD